MWKHKTTRYKEIIVLTNQKLSKNNFLKNNGPNLKANKTTGRPFSSFFST